MTEQFESQEWFNRRSITLDLYGLSDEERAEGSVLLGGSGAEIVWLGDNFNYKDVTNVVFEWGDPKAEQVFATMLKHNNPPNEIFLQFTASTIIYDDIWSLVIQDNDFNPKTAFHRPENYFVLPTEKETGNAVLKHFLRLPTPRPELISKIGPRWVVFELGTNLRNEDIADQYEPAESMVSQKEYSSAEVIDFLENIISQRDFDKLNDDDNRSFTTHIAHWVLETFGHKRGNSNEYVLYPDSENTIPGNLLPIRIQPLITHEWRDEVFLSNKNTVQLETKHEYIEDDPVLPDWDYIKTLSTYNAMLEYVRDHPEILCGVKLTKTHVLPQVRLRFSPDPFVSDWGLEYLISKLGIGVAPFGKESKTWKATNYVIEQHDDLLDMAKTTCELAVLAARYAKNWGNEPFAAESLAKLIRRLRGEESIPLCAAEHQTKPANSILNLLIEQALNREFK